MKSGMQTIDRAMMILKSFTNEKTEYSLAELHKKLNVSKSSLQRVLNALVEHNMLEKNEENKTYKLGMEVYFLGQMVEKNSHLLTFARPYMKALVEKYGESITLNVILDGQRTCIECIPGKHELTTLSFVGQTSPLYAGTSAKLLLAYLPQKEINNYLETVNLIQIDKNTIIDKEKLLSELKKIREQGYTISIEERVSGACAISVPIKNRVNEVLAGLTFNIPIARLDEDHIADYVNELKKAANAISEKIKY